MRASALLLMVAAACGHHGAEELVIATPAAKVSTPPKGVPHGGFINRVAVTEQADAALTIDTLNELRLWPTLDGKRQPIPIAASGVSEIALGHTGDQLLAVLLDQAGVVHLLAIDHDGVVRAKHELPGEVAIEQVAALDDGVLVERVDQAIERYSADGKLTGRLVAAAGEKLGAFSVRHGSAAVLVVAADVTPEPEKPGNQMGERKPTLADPVPFVPAPPELASMLRWIVLGDELRWGTSLKMPPQIDARQLALSPNHHRIAVLDASSLLLAVLDLDPLPSRHAGPSISASATASIGFSDDDHVATTQNQVLWWVAPQTKPDHDPWDVQPSSVTPMATGGDGGAVGDGLAVTGFGSSLALSDYHATRYLGWKNVGTGPTTMFGSEIAMLTSATHVLLLDDQLAQHGESDITELPGGTSQYSVWVGPHHVITERAKDDKFKIELIDANHPDKAVTVGLFAFVERLEFEPELGILAVGTAGEIARFKIDVDHGTVTALPTIKASLQVQAVRLLDPARSDGAIAVVTSYGEDGQHVAVYREPAAGAKFVHVAKTYPLPTQQVLGVDATGLVYVRGEQMRISSLRAGKPERQFPEGFAADSITPSHDAAHLAIIRGNELALVDRMGAEQWHEPLWGTVTVMFTTDDHRLVVRTSGGIVLLDAATGARLAAVCGYGFGIEDKPPLANALGVTPVCEDQASIEPHSHSGVLPVAHGSRPS